ncbi:MAG: PEGA domain-containing protein [Calditrichaeota bacterium]|nr:PEGA domain-containing protein [Calditrichota bacterium]
MKIFLCLCALFCLPVQLLAQSPVLQVVGQPEKISTGKIEEKYPDGRYCAAIRVNTSLQYLNFDAYDGIVKVENHPGYYLVYVAPDEQVLQVYYSNPDPLKIVLSEIGIRLAAQELWTMNLQSGAAPEMWKISINITPPDAEIFIDNQNYGSNAKPEVSGGVHQLRIEKKGYETIRGTISVDENNRNFTYTLRALYGQITIRTIPENNAMVVIKDLAGEEVVANGYSPMTRVLDAGYYLIEISKEGYEPLTLNRRFLFTEKEPPTLMIKLDKQKFNINFAGTKDAHVYIDDQYVGKIPLKNHEVDHGIHQIIVAKKGYKTQQRKYDINQNENPDFALERDSAQVSAKGSSTLPSTFGEFGGYYGYQKITPDINANIWGAELPVFTKSWLFLFLYEANIITDENNSQYPLFEKTQYKTIQHLLYTNFAWVPIKNKIGVVMLGAKYAQNIIYQSIELDGQTAFDTTYVADPKFGPRIDIIFGNLQRTNIMLTYEPPNFSKMFDQTGVIKIRLNTGGKNYYVGASVETRSPDVFERNVFRFFMGIRFQKKYK